MDDCTGRRTAVQHGIVRKGSSSFKDFNSEDDRTSNCVGRVGCSTRLKSRNGTIVNSNLEKAKTFRSSFYSSSSDTPRGSSSKVFPIRSNHSKLKFEGRIQPSVKETTRNKLSIRRGKAEVSRQSQSEDSKSMVGQNFSVNTGEVGSSDATLSVASKKVHTRSVLQGLETSLASCASVQQSRSSRNTGLSAQVSKTHGDGMRSHSCASRFAPGSSSSLPGHNFGSSNHRSMTNAIKARCSDSESSSSKTKLMTMSTSGANPVSQRRNVVSRPSLYLGVSSPQRASRSYKKLSVASGVGATVPTRRTSTFNTREMVTVCASSSSRLHSDPVMPQQLPRTEYMVSGSTCISSESFSAEFQPSFEDSQRHLDSSTESVNRSSITFSEDHSTCLSNDLSLCRNIFQINSMDGISEALLALERIEQDVELTYELALETNFLLDGLLRDQHRDLRLDIDNMSYEELLALEEKMGNVSTALSEEALSKCLTRSCYLPNSPPGLLDSREEDIKCSICQEEYMAGDEVGRLDCEHGYHVDCIQDWLRRKNWCPICKVAALSS